MKFEMLHTLFNRKWNFIDEKAKSKLVCSKIVEMNCFYTLKAQIHLWTAIDNIFNFQPFIASKVSDLITPNDKIKDPVQMKNDSGKEIKNSMKSSYK